jgi:Anti-sigma-28 factor, FlgM
MSDALRHAIANGEYRVDVDAVAAAMIARAHALRSARRACTPSEMLVAGDSLELRRVGSGEVQALPLEGAA